MNQQTCSLSYGTTPLLKLKAAIRIPHLILKKIINYNPNGENYTNVTKDV